MLVSKSSSHSLDTYHNSKQEIDLTSASKQSDLGLHFLFRLHLEHLQKVNALTLIPPVPTFVVCFLFCVIFLGILYCKQYGTRSDCSLEDQTALMEESYKST